MASTACSSCYHSSYYINGAYQRRLQCYQCKAGYTLNYETYQCELDTQCD